MHAKRRGLAYAIALAAVLILSIVCLALWGQLIGNVRQVARLTDDTAQYYIAEALFAKTVNELKKQPWSHWARELGAARVERPSYRGADCLVVVDLVRNASGEPRTGLLDVLVRVDYEGFRMTYAERIRLRAISDLRPTQAEIRRRARLAQDIEDPAGRRDAVACVDRAERLCAANRATTGVNVRYLRALTDGGATLASAAAYVRALATAERGAPPPPSLPERIAAELRPRAAVAGRSEDEAARERNRKTAQVLARAAADLGGAAANVASTLAAAGYAGEVAREGTVLEELAGGDARFFADPLAVGDIDAALARYAKALEAARAQAPVNARETVPRLLFRIAQAKVAAAERRPYDAVEPGTGGCVRLVSASAEPSRTAGLEDADQLYRELVDGYRGSPEAAHAFIPWAWSQMKRVTAANPAAWNAARACAYAILERLRREYPLYHLWHEHVVTALRDSAGSPAPPEDEVVYWVESRIQPLLVWGRNRYQGVAPAAGEDETQAGTVMFASDLELKNVRYLCPGLVAERRAHGPAELLPDGSRAVLRARRPDGRVDLVLLDLAYPDRLRVLVANRDVQGMPDVSRDGRRLLMGIANGDSDHELCELALDTLQLKPILRSPEPAMESHWSPDGRHILRVAEGRHAVVELDADGRNPRVIYRCPIERLLNLACYSPEGDEISFNEWRGDASGAWPDSQAWLVRRDGSGRRAFGPPGYHYAGWAFDRRSRPGVKIGPTTGGMVVIANEDGSRVEPLGGDEARLLARSGWTSWWTQLGGAR